jgi:hypothetical protein
VGKFSTTEIATLRYASFPSAGVRPARTASFGGKRKSLFAAFLAALHHSRRIQSRRVLRQYRHLIDQGDERTAFNSQSNLEDRQHVDQ